MASYPKPFAGPSGNYPAGSDRWSGTARVVEPSTSEASAGATPGDPYAAQFRNYFDAVLGDLATAALHGAMARWDTVLPWPEINYASGEDDNPEYLETFGEIVLAVPSGTVTAPVIGAVGTGDSTEFPGQNIMFGEGPSWALMAGSLPNIADVCATGTHLLAVTTAGSVHSSDDGGATWTFRPALGSNRTRLASHLNRVFAMGPETDGAIYYSDDAGATATAATFPGPDFGTATPRAMAFSNAGVGLYCEDARVYRSPDSGATWIAAADFADSGASSVCFSEYHQAFVVKRVDTSTSRLHIFGPTGETFTSYNDFNAELTGGVDSTRAIAAAGPVVAYIIDRLTSDYGRLRGVVWSADLVTWYPTTFAVAPPNIKSPSSIASIAGRLVVGGQGVVWIGSKLDGPYHGLIPVAV